MDVIAEPDKYVPSIGDNGDYIDIIPSFNNLINGMRCICGTRKEHCYKSASELKNHVKTKTHEKWLKNLNLNKANFYSENEDLKELVGNQKLIIAKLEKKLNKKINTIDILTDIIKKKEEKNKVKKEPEKEFNFFD
jgi:hypothetical protein